MCRSRAERRYALAWEVGAVRVLWREGGGRFQDAMVWAQERGRRALRQMEEGADVSGVT